MLGPVCRLIKSQEQKLRKGVHVEAKKIVDETYYNEVVEMFKTNDYVIDVAGNDGSIPNDVQC